MIALPAREQRSTFLSLGFVPAPYTLRLLGKSLVGKLDADPASWRFTLTPEGSGTRLAQWMRVGPARSGINLAIDAMPDKEGAILRRRMAELRANMEATVRGVKQLAEAE